MICNKDTDELVELVLKQMEMFGLSGNKRVYIEKAIGNALQRLETNFKAINSKYYYNNGIVQFSTNHADQYTLFLWYLSNAIYRYAKDTHDVLEHECAEQIFYLNRVMNSCNWFYAIELPEHFYVEHPIGSVLGRASYGDYLCIYHGVTIGGSFDKSGNIIYPTIGNKVTCFANSSILGNSLIGDNVVIAANTIVVNKKIPDNCLVIGSGNDILIKPNDTKLSLWKTLDSGE